MKRGSFQRDEPLAAAGAQAGGVDAVAVGAADDDRCDLLGTQRVGHTEHGAFGDARLGSDHLLDFLGADVLARALDHALDPADEEQPAVLVEGALVTGADPAVDERLRARLLVLEVAEHHVTVAEGDLAALATGNRLQLVVEDADLDPLHRRADVARAELPAVAGLAPDAEGAGLGHPPDGRQVDAEAGGEAGVVGVGDDQAVAVLAGRRCVTLRLHQEVEVGGEEDREGGVVEGDVLPEARRAEAVDDVQARPLLGRDRE